VSAPAVPGAGVRWVLRHEVPVDDTWHDVRLPGPVVHIATRRPDVVEIWTLHTDGGPEVTRTFRVYGTGQPITDAVRHVGTAIVPGGALVWHLMERAS
jgi:hypothetical protein